MEAQEKQYADLWQYIENHKPIIENALRENLPFAPTHIEKQFNETLEMALEVDEKRFCSILTLLSAELVDGTAFEVLPSAVAVEFIYTSSLIIDYLPCMYKSKKPKSEQSLQNNVGEGLAILVGLGFLNASYPLVFINHSGMPERAMAAHSEIVECVGAAGLIGGQTVDLSFVKSVSEFEKKDSEAKAIKSLKTSAIMRLAMRLGAILSGANYLEVASVSRFAELLGDAYQLSDDLIDLQKNADIFDLVEARETLQLKLNSTVDEAKRILIDNFSSNEARSCLIQLTEYLAEKKV
jgi:geranylgeranyl diphosphate synthase type II